MSGPEPVATTTTEPERWAAAHRSGTFRELRRRHRGFTFPVTLGFLVWYACYVLLATYAPALLAVRVGGNVTVGLLLGVAQILSTFVVTAVYVRFAHRRLDPLAARVRSGMGLDGGPA
ncbi:DUF485 domain-containing protein [Pseudonocardia sp.]|uniref:DUF485 domain-containing protein n=1 Tax=Pseudonocardia sp. TaxID=60912 RepID=UPI003D0C7467